MLMSEDGRFQLLRKLEESIDKFRTGKDSKTTAISSILRILGENVDVEITQSQKDLTFDSYLTEILSIQSTLNETNATHPGESTGESNQVSSLKQSKGTTRRTRDETESEGEEDDDNKSSKKQRLLESDMPWFSTLNESTTSGKPSYPIRSGLTYLAQIRLGRLGRFRRHHHRPT